MSVRSRWLKKYRTARAWMAKWRQRYIWHPTPYNKWKYEVWKKAAAYAKRVLERHPAGGTVRRPHEAVVMNVRNQSSRSGVKPRIIVLHSTESSNAGGLGDLKAIGAWFDNPRASASSHVCVDGEGQSARYVDDERKAWHVVSYNSVALGIEQIGHASQSSWPEAQYQKAAQYVAYWSKKYDIPIEHSTTHGVCRHSDLGPAGGGHHDPGSGYDLSHVLSLARNYRARGW